MLTQVEQSPSPSLARRGTRCREVGRLAGVLSCESEGTLLGQHFLHLTHRLDGLVLLNDQVVVLEAVLSVAAELGILVGDLLDRAVHGPGTG